MSGVHLLLVVAVVLITAKTHGFQPSGGKQPNDPRQTSQLQMFFADESAEAPLLKNEESTIAAIPVEGGTAIADDDIQVAIDSGDAPSIRMASTFMVENFWLASPQNLVVSGKDASSISDGALSTLIDSVAEDLTETYGERMGRRTLEAKLLTASDVDGLLGLVGMESRLFDKTKMNILTSEKSEFMLKNAVASLGPKQRRQYKDSTAAELVNELLPPDFDLVCCLSNLSVSPRSRRRGVAMKLCKEAENVAKNDLGFNNVYLKVEKGNEAARGLYENKLGFREIGCDLSSIGLRVDVNDGSFVEEQHETLILTKNI